LIVVSCADCARLNYSRLQLYNTIINIQYCVSIKVGLILLNEYIVFMNINEWYGSLFYLLKTPTMVHFTLVNFTNIFLFFRLVIDNILKNLLHLYIKYLYYKLIKYFYILVYYIIIQKAILQKWCKECFLYNELEYSTFQIMPWPKINLPCKKESRGPIHEAYIQQFLSYVSCKTKLQCILERNTLKKFDLQESYNYFKIKLKISFVNRAPGHLISDKGWLLIWSPSMHLV